MHNVLIYAAGTEESHARERQPRRERATTAGEESEDRELQAD